MDDEVAAAAAEPVVHEYILSNDLILRCDLPARRKKKRRIAERIDFKILIFISFF